MFKITNFGDWAKVHNIIKNRLPKAYQETSEKVLKRVTLKAERIVVLHLRNQDLGWQPLKEKTLARKARRGESEKTLIATTDYLRSITAFVENGVGFVGVRKKKVNSSGNSLVDIAATHEFGSISRSIPARPLWQPSLIELSSWIKKNKIQQVEMIKALKK